MSEEINKIIVSDFNVELNRVQSNEVPEQLEASMELLQSFQLKRGNSFVILNFITFAI
jgi:hypothetical protein